MREVTVEEWVAALRSGKYRQTKGYLRDQTGFCCLGVGCDLADPDLWEEAVDRDGFVYGADIPTMQMPPSSTPLPLLKFWGDLAAMNDAGRTFSEIADELERIVEAIDATSKWAAGE